MKRLAILVIRPDDGFSVALRECGFEVLNLGLIKTEPLADLTELDKTLGRIDQYDGIFLTSPAAAEILIKQLNGSGFSGKVYVLGQRTREALSGSRLKVVFSHTANTAEDMIASSGAAEFAGKKLLFVRGDRTVGTIRQMLNDKAEVEEIIVYRTIEIRPDDAAIDNIKEKIEKGVIEWVCFFSPSGVNSFMSILGGYDLGIKAAAIGETTAAAIREAGINLEFISQRANAVDFAAGLAAHIKGIE